jgi:protein-glutamine gamma-glutamyltransferase
MLRIDTVLNILTYCIALLGFVPLFPYLAMPPRIVFPLALVGGLLVDRMRYRLPVWLTTAVSFLFFFYYAAQFTRNNLVGPAVNLLIILLAVRLIGEKNARTCLQIFALALFSFTSSSLFNLSPVFLIYLCLILVMIAVSLVILTFRDTAAEPFVSSRGLRKILSVSLIMPVAAVPLMLLLFVIMPRTQFPLWNFLNVGGGQATGFSEKVEPGIASTIGERRDVAFRAHCPKLPKDRLYWRGIVLNSFAGSAWVRSEPPAYEQKGVPRGETIRQTIFPEPGRMTHLVALNVPWVLTGVRSTRSDDHTFTLQGPGAGRIRYEAVSVQDETIKGIPEVNRRYYLRVPEDVSPRLAALGKSIAGNNRRDMEKFSQLEDFFAASTFSYATTNLPVGHNPLDQFLFVSKRGNCEYFASSFALLLRLAGVPARLVGGYYGGDYNDLGGYYVVTAARAHVWVEAFITGTGWVTIDPSRWAVNFSGVREAARKSLAQQLAISIDAFSYYWNLAVINYDLERQLSLISSANAGLKRVSLRATLKVLLTLFVMLVVAAVAAIMVGKWRRYSPEEKILAKFFRQVRKVYRKEISSDTGLHELAAALHNPAASRFVMLYGSAVYHDRQLLPEELHELEHLVRKLSEAVSSGRAGCDDGH